MALVLHIDRLAPSMNGTGGLMRMHHREYARVRDAWTVLVRGAARLEKAAAPCRVEIVRRYPGRPLDLDNLYAAAKVPLDALRRAGVIPDDDPETVVSLSCTQRKAARRSEAGTTIRLTPS